MNDPNCDIAIIGGGPVGASLALALRDSGLKVCVLEARRRMPPARMRARLRCLTAAACCWNVSASGTCCKMSLPIRTIHISQRRSFGRALLRAAELNVPELGYVLPYSALQNALQNVLSRAVAHPSDRATGHSTMPPKDGDQVAGNPAGVVRAGGEGRGN